MQMQQLSQTKERTIMIDEDDLKLSDDTEFIHGMEVVTDQSYISEDEAVRQLADYFNLFLGFPDSVNPPMERLFTQMFTIGYSSDRIDAVISRAINSSYYRHSPYGNEKTFAMLMSQKDKRHN